MYVLCEACDDACGIALRHQCRVRPSGVQQQLCVRRSAGEHVRGKILRHVQHHGDALGIERGTRLLWRDE
jgi:hypothetical protein